MVSHECLARLQKSTQCVISQGRESVHIIWPSLFSPPARTTLSDKFSSDAVRAQLVHHSIIVWTPKWTLRPGSLNFTHVLMGREILNWENTLGGYNRASLEMQSEDIIKQDWRCTCRGHDCTTLEAVIDCVWRYTWMPWSREAGNALRAQDRWRLEEYFQAVNLEVVNQEVVDLDVVDLEAVNLEALNQDVVDWEGGVTRAETVFVGSLVSLRIQCCDHNTVHRELIDEALARSGRESTLQWCSTWRMLYSVLTHDHGMQWQNRMT